MSDQNLSAHAPNEPVPFISLIAQHQTLAHEVTAAVGRVLAEQKFILGDEVSQFETEIAKYCDSRSAIGCASGTDALILALMGARSRSRRRGHHQPVHVLRDRQFDLSARCEAGVCGHRSGDVQCQSGRSRGSDHAPHKSDHAGASLRPVCRHGAAVADRSEPRRFDRRRCLPGDRSRVSWPTRGSARHDWLFQFLPNQESRWCG